MAEVIAFIRANWVEIASLLYVIVDGVIYFVPSLKANGLLQQLELWLQGQGKPPQAS